MGRPLQTQQGVALVLVMWVLALLMIIAASTSSVQRNEIAMATAMIQERQARAAIDAAHHLMLYRLKHRPPLLEEDAWKPDGMLRDWEYNGRSLRIKATPENGRIDINMAPTEVLDKLLEEAGLELEEAERIRDAILDWKDPDDASRLAGAEDPDYESEGLPYGAKDNRFDILDELRQVRGITPELYKRIAPALTVHSGQRTINPVFASKLVLYSLPGMDHVTADSYIAERDEMLSQGLTASMPVGVSGNYISPGNLQIYRIYAETEMDHGGIVAGELLATLGRRATGQELKDRGYVVLERNFTPHRSDNADSESAAQPESEE